MKIVFIYGHDWGGSYVRSQARQLVGRGHELTVICPGEGPFSEACRLDGLDVLICPFQGSSIADLPRVLRSIGMLTSQLARLRPDVVHYFLIKATIVGRLASWFARVPVRVSQLGGPLTLEMRAFRALDLLTSVLDTMIFAPSIGVLKLYERYAITRRKVRLLYFGWDLESFSSAGWRKDRRRRQVELGLGGAGHVVIMVAHMYGSDFGRFQRVSMKGHETLIESAPSVLSAYPDTRFLVVGEDPDGSRKNFDRLKTMTEDLGVADAFVFTGHRTDVADLISIADFGVVPSLTENCGGALEPLSAGIPVVASNTGGLPELVIPNLTGFRFEPADPVSLAKALREALALSSEQRQILGNNGQRLVVGLFNPERCGEVQEALYLGYGGNGQMDQYLEAVDSLST